MFIFIFICTIKDDEYSGRSMCNFSIVLLTNYWYFKIFYSVGTDFWLLLKLIQWDHKKKKHVDALYDLFHLSINCTFNGDD